MKRCLQAYVLLILCAQLVSCAATHRSAVLVGPVVLGKGIPGVVGKDTPRQQVINLLGRPLIEREDVEEWRKEGYRMDPRPTDEFTGIFVRVSWDNRDRPVGLSFDLKEFARRYRAEQRILLRNGEKQIVVDRQLRLSDAEKTVGKLLNAGEARIVVKEQSLYVMEGKSPCLVLHFSYKDHRLEDVSVGL